MLGLAGGLDGSEFVLQLPSLGWNGQEVVLWLLWGLT